MWFKKSENVDRTSFLIGVDGIPVQVTRKNVKYLRLRVTSPNGEVQVSAPFTVDDKKIVEFVHNHIGWIRKKQELVARSKNAQKNPIDQNEAYLLGKRYKLCLFANPKPSAVVKGETINIYLPNPELTETKEILLRGLCRLALHNELDILVPMWSRKMNVEPRWWRIRQMRTRWGTCNTTQRHVWFSEELGKFPRRLIEYIVVHELCHLLERGHTPRFYELMNRFLPDWEERKKELRAV